MSPTTRSCSARATASCSTTSSTARCSPTTSASTCTARPRPIPRSRRPAAMRSTCSRRCRICKAAPTGRGPREPLSAGDRSSASRSDLLPGLSKQIVDLAPAHAAGLPGSPVVVSRRGLRPRAGAHAECVVSAAQPQRRSSTASISSAPEPIPAPDCPACCPRPASSTRWCRMQTTFVPRPADRPPRERPLDGLTRPTSRRAGTRCANGSRTFLAASLAAAARGARSGVRAVRLLSPRRRRRRCAPMAAPDVVGRAREARSTRAYAGDPMPTPADRALAAVVPAFAIPRGAARGAARGFRVGRRRAAATTTLETCTTTPRASPARSAR